MRTKLLSVSLLTFGALAACQPSPPPTVAVSEPTAGAAVDLERVTVRGSVGANVRRLTYALGVGPERDVTAGLSGTSFSFEATGFQDGPNTITVYAYDAEGKRAEGRVTVSLRPRVASIGFGSFNARAVELRGRGVRVFGPNASVAQDLEPEYIAVAPDSKTAWVTLQENNALAVLDLEKVTATDIVPLGFKDHAAQGNGLDPSDRDGPSNGPLANIGNWPVRGLYQPDGVAAYTANGRTYIVTANEGDARDYDAFAEEVRAGAAAVALDPVAFPNAAALKGAAQLGRLNVTNTLGDTDGDGDFDALYAFGARSFSIRDGAGALVYDSGGELERRTAAAFPANFNANNTGNSLDDRSDNKGPEPEGVAVGAVGGRTYAYVGLERVGGVMVYDVSDPRAPVFVEYENNRDFAQLPGPGAGRDLAPEGLLFIPASEAPTGVPLLVVANEVSGTVSVYGVAVNGALDRLGSYATGVYSEDGGVAEIPAFDPASKRLFVVRSDTVAVDVLDLANPASPALVKSISVGTYGGSPNSVAAKNGVVAVAVEAVNRQASGRVVFLTPDGTLRADVVVGSLPDMLTFTPDGRSVLVANEGEPSADYANDPEGSVTLINVPRVLAP